MLSTTVHHRWRGLVQSTLGLWLESPCPLCQRSAAIRPCPTCRTRLAQDQLPAAAHMQRHQGLMVFSWGLYQGTSRQLMRLVKYEQQSDLAVFMGQVLGGTWLEVMSAGQLSPAQAKPIVVPIPLHSEKLNQRGFNQAERIAEGFCQMTRSPLVANGLRRTENTLPQFGLSMIQRFQNVSGVFQVMPGLRLYRDRPILLVDDIYTTGATALAAAKILQRGGYQVMGIATVLRAKTESTRIQPTKPIDSL